MKPTRNEIAGAPPRGIVNAVLLALALLAAGCDKGLEPLNEPSGFSGTIYFRNWPPPDQVKELRLLAFNTYPRDSVNLLNALLGGGAAIYPPVGSPNLPKFIDSLHYSFTTEGTILQVRNYEYIVVAWRYGNNFLADWRPAGVYALTPGTFTPSPVRVLLHRIQPDIDILVDFQNPPPRPWR